MTTAEKLGCFIAENSWEQLAPHDIEKAKRFILDILGCIIGASQEERTKILVDTIRQQGGSMHSSVLGHGFKTSAMNAAFLNAAMGHIYDFDDDHREAATHTTTVVLPVVLALGEKNRSSGKEVLNAFMLGSEITTRLGKAFLGKTHYRGFHATATCGVFGAAAAAAAILKLNSRQAASALGLAGGFSSGNIQWRTGDSWHKPVQPGHAAMCGVLAACLAEKDFIGPLTIFDGPDGFLETHCYQGIYDQNLILNDIGKTWEMAKASIKLHACCRWGASAIDCALNLKKQGIVIEKIEDIRIKTYDIALEVLTKPEDRKLRPTTTMDAQFSLPYMVAVALTDGEAGVEQFREKKLQEPVALDLIDKMRWEVSPDAEALYPEAYLAEMDITLSDGTIAKAKVRHPKGDPENPASDNEIEQKFKSLTFNHLDVQRQNAVINVVKKLETINDLGCLLDALMVMEQ